MKSPTEAQIQQTCTELLELDGWRALRTDPTSDRSRGKGFGEKGMADHLYIRYRGAPCSTSHPQEISLGLAEVLWIEYKSATGKVKPHQLAWSKAERVRGALVLLAGIDFPASIEGFKTWYVKTSGLARRIKSQRKN